MPPGLYAYWEEYPEDDLIPLFDIDAARDDEENDLDKTEDENDDEQEETRNALASAGMGTDEDYGGTDNRF
jgi:hypothetical protein